MNVPGHLLILEHVYSNHTVFFKFETFFTHSFVTDASQKKKKKEFNCD